MVDAAQAMRDGGPVLGCTEPHIPHVKISSFERILPKNANWRTAGEGDTPPSRRGTSRWRDGISPERSELPLNAPG